MAHAPSPVHASPQCVQRRTAWLGRAGAVDAIAIGAWRWSCSASCTGASCVLGPGTAGTPAINGTLPREIGMLSCRSKITDVYATAPPAAPADAAYQPCRPHEDHCRCRVFRGYRGLVGSLPATISALTAVSRMCAPASPPARTL
jgi:hypothetical protein